MQKDDNTPWRSPRRRNITPAGRTATPQEGTTPSQRINSPNPFQSLDATHNDSDTESDNESDSRGPIQRQGTLRRQSKRLQNSRLQATKNVNQDQNQETDQQEANGTPRQDGATNQDGANNQLDNTYIIYDSDDDSIMGDTPTEKSVKTILITKYEDALVPNAHPHKLQVITFKNQLGRALMQCPGSTGTDLDGGHLYLILNEDEFKKKLSPAAEYTTKPTVPAKPASGEISKTLFYEIRRAQTARHLHKEYDTQAKNLIETKFPTCFIGLLDNEGELPWDTTARSMLEHLATSEDPKAVNDSYSDLLVESEVKIGKVCEVGEKSVGDKCVSVLDV